MFGEIIKKIGKYLLTVIILFFFLFPIYWLVITAFKRSEDWFSLPPVFIPRVLTLDSFFGLKGGLYGHLTTSVANISPYLINSTVVGVITALVSTIIAASAAYAISRYKIGGMAFASFIISIRMLPPIAAALPFYVIFSKLRLINTWGALILPYLVITTPLSTWVLITFFNDIPAELDDAAQVDGCSPVKAFFHVILPLSAPGLAAVTTLAFITCWGEFLLALILTIDEAAQTLPIFLGRYITGWRVAWGPLAAAGIINMLPVIIFSLLMQKYLIRGLTFGAVKG